MPIAPKDRPLNQLREDIIEQLVLNYGHEKLSCEALERRLDQAHEVTDHDMLLSLVADLDSFADEEYDAFRDHFLYAPEDLAENPKPFSISSPALTVNMWKWCLKPCA